MGRLLKSIKSNLNKLIYAEWIPKEPDDPSVIQDTTNVMANGGPMQIRYQDGGVRTIFPYGWNTSKNGDVLLMCYKEDGGVRSYRFDRIQQFIFDSDIISSPPIEVEEQSNQQSVNNPTLTIQDYHEESEELPDLPDTSENVVEQQEYLPFDNAIDVLDKSKPEENEEIQQPQLEIQDYNSNNEEQKSANIKIKRLLRKGD